MMTVAVLALHLFIDNAPSVVGQINSTSFLFPNFLGGIGKILVLKNVLFNFTENS